MRAVVIGGTGFLGPEVVQQLVAASCDVAIFHRGVTEPALPPSVRHFHGDRSELATHRSALRSFDPDVVIDMRPMTEEPGSWSRRSPGSRSVRSWSAVPTSTAPTDG